ncbi:MAG: PTS transporter subunit IIC [Sporolactobacillus sp.]
MGILKEIVNYVLNLGAPVFVPILMLVLGLIARMKLKNAFMSAITLAIAFAGMSMVVNYMMAAIGPAAQAMSKATGITLNAVDMGWTGAAAISWAWPLAFTLFPLVLLVNFIMLALNWTKTLNVDMWNVWGKILTAFLVYKMSGSIVAAYGVAAIQIVLELKLGDMWQRHIQDLTGIPGVTVTHIETFAAVLMNPVNKLLDKIPFFNYRFDAAGLKKKIGIFSENSVMGFIIGVLLGFGAMYSVSKSLMLGVEAATAMALFPMISKLFMQALSPLADAMGNFMKKHFKDREIYIGLDWPILAGRSELWVTAIILVPVFIIFAMILPGNDVLPFAGVINYCLAVGGLLLTGGNLLRMIVLGVIFTPLYLYGATFFAPQFTELAKSTKAISIPAHSMVTWSSIEAPEFRYLFGEAANLNWWAIILSALLMVMFWWLYKTAMHDKVPSERYQDFESKVKNAGNSSQI